MQHKQKHIWPGMPDIPRTHNNLVQTLWKCVRCDFNFIAYMYKIRSHNKTKSMRCMVVVVFWIEWLSFVCWWLSRCVCVCLSVFVCAVSMHNWPNSCLHISSSKIASASVFYGFRSICTICTNMHKHAHTHAHITEMRTINSQPLHTSPDQAHLHCSKPSINI